MAVSDGGWVTAGGMAAVVGSEGMDKGSEGMDEGSGGSECTADEDGTWREEGTEESLVIDEVLCFY